MAENISSNPSDRFNQAPQSGTRFLGKVAGAIGTTQVTSEGQQFNPTPGWLTKGHFGRPVTSDEITHAVSKASRLTAKQRRQRARQLTEVRKEKTQREEPDRPQRKRYTGRGDLVVLWGRREKKPPYRNYPRGRRH